MDKSPIIYEWECPICGLTRVGLTYRAPIPVDDQARNAIEGHVRQASGLGHGEGGEFPLGFTSVKITEYIQIKKQFGSRATEGKG